MGNMFILADDWGWGELSCHGHPWLKTPSINLYGDPAYRAVAGKLKEQLPQTRERLNETNRDDPHIQRVIEFHWND